MKIKRTIEKTKFSGMYFWGFWLFFLFLWILYGFNTWTVDSVSYKPIYDIFVFGGWFAGVERGFGLFMYITAHFGFSYQQFLMAFSFVGLMLIAMALLRVSKRPLSVLFLYFIFPFAHDVSGLRNFMAMAIVFWGTQYLITDNLKGNIKFCLSVLCAMMFHISAAIYFLLLLVKLDIKKIKFITKIALAIELILVLCSNILANFIQNIVPKAVVYLERGIGGTQLYTKLLFIFYFGIILYIAEKLYRETHKDIKKINLNIVPEYVRYSNLVYKVMQITVMFYPIILYDVDFFRLERNLLLMFYVMATNVKYFDDKLKISKDKLVVLVCVIAFIACLAFFFEFLFSFNSVVLPIFKNNSILDF